MSLSAVRNLWKRQPAAPVQQRVLAGTVRPLFPPEPAARSSAWTRERIDIAGHLWGEGYGFPGGEIETLRLAKPLGLSGATSVMLLGAGAGGAAGSLTTKTGTWVAGFEADAGLAAAGIHLIARKNLAKRVRIDRWDPAEPVFEARSFHHVLALEPLNGARPEPVLAAAGPALKAGGQFVMTELVADNPLNPSDPAIAAWSDLEGRDPEAMPSEVAITRILGRLAFDVRVVEDISQRHMHQAVIGWRAAMRVIGDSTLSREVLKTYEREAAMWEARVRLFQLGRLRMIRWHAIGGG